MRPQLLTFRLLLLMLLVSGLVQIFAGTTGKIVGKVTDAQSKEALPGVNIIIEGTMMGAATDLEGEYLILNVPAGIYTLKATMIGYNSARITNIKVSIDLTTTSNLELGETVLDLGREITVTAEREVIKKDMTSSLSAVGAEEIQSMPVQEVADVLELQAGLVRDATGGIHIRGGRSGEVAYWVDGIAATDVYSGNMGVAVENASVQELQVISGTFNAEYGQAMSGIVNIVTKDGGAAYNGELSGFIGDYVPTKGDREFGVYKPYASDIGAIRAPEPDSVEQINPLDNFNNIFNVQATLSGPVPFLSKMTFFSNLRYFTTDGYRFGLRWFTPQGQKGDAELVPMEPFQKLSGQIKLTYQFSGSLKLSYNLLGNKNKFRWYDRFYKYNPDGDYQRFENSSNHILGLTHVLTPSTFYEVKFSSFGTEYRHYVYEDPFKTVTYDSFRVINGVKTKVKEYVTSTGTYVAPDSGNLAPASWSFQDGGTKMQHFKRNTNYYVGKLDFTSQINKRHQIKAGFEAKFITLKLDEFNIIPLVVGTVPVDPFQPMKGDITTPNYNTYKHQPFQFSIYLQDKMEFKEMIVNLGLRFDYFDADGQTYRDPKDPNINDPYLKEHCYKNPTAPDSQLVAYTMAEREAFWWKKTTPKYQLGPRFGIAYPITDRGVIHFSYGHFFQMPPLQNLYGDLDVSKTSSNTTFLTNADLEPERTVMYEIGLQQQFAEDVGVDVTLFYRDIRDYIGSSPLQPTYLKSVAYQRYTNKDYSNVKGITFSLNKRYANYFEASLDYTYMVSEGTASNPQDEYNDRLNDRAPRIQIIPLGWDQRHTFNGHISVGTSGWRASLLGRFWTGTPYTPTFAVGEVSGASAFSGLSENSSRKPNITTFDLRLNKQFKIGHWYYSAFVVIYNLFDARGQTGVYDDTGDADYTLSVRKASADPKRVSLLDDNAVHTEWYIEPRQVQAGVSVSF